MRIEERERERESDGASETTVSDEAMSKWQTMRCSENARGRDALTEGRAGCV